MNTVDLEHLHQENKELRQQLSDARATVQYYRGFLEILRRFGQPEIDNISLPRLCQDMLAYLRQILPVWRLSITMFNIPQRQATLMAVNAATETHLKAGTILPLETFGDLALLQQQKVQQITHLMEQSPDNAIYQQLVLEGNQAGLIVPLVNDGELIGTLNLGKLSPGAFDPQIVSISSQVAGYLALLLQQGRIRAQLQQHAVELEQRLSELEKLRAAERESYELRDTLRQVAQVLNSSLNRQQVLDSILEQLAQVIDYDSATVMLLGADGSLDVVSRQSFHPESLPARSLKVQALAHVRQVIEAQSPIVIADTALDKRWLLTPESAYIRCWLGVPLLVQQRVIGLLNLNKEQPNVYGVQHAEIAMMFAAQAAVAIHNSWLFQQAQQEIRVRKRAEAERARLLEQTRVALAETQSLYTLSRSLIMFRGLPDLLQTAVSSVAEALPADRVILHLVDMVTQTVTHQVESGVRAMSPGMVPFAELEQTIIGKALRKLEPLVRVGHTLAETSQIIQPTLNLVGSIVVVPLIFMGQPLGAITAVNSADNRYFQPRDVNLMVAMANQLALSIENTRLFANLQQTNLTLDQERDSLARRVEMRTAELSQANVELARAARLKDEFLASMSHELRTPLNTILGKSEVLQEGVFGDLNERQRRAIQTVEESGRHLLELINDILDVAKVEAGKLELDMAPLSLRSVCEASVRLVMEDAHKKHLTLHTEYDPQVHVIRADGRRLKQILVNLLINAVKFTPEGGHVGITVTGDKSHNIVHLIIWDTGIGIDPQDMEHLFKPFVQLDSSLSRQHAGTGLGLSLVYRLTEMHGGSVSVTSQPGQGSQFTVSLPWSQSTSQLPDETSPSPATLPIPAIPPGTPLPIENNSLRILIAEDNAETLEMVQNYLQYRQYHVLAARNGLEAIARTIEEHPDLILMDIQMPELDGLEAMRQIRAYPHLGHLPIIAFTALAMPGDRERCLQAGASAYVQKPIALQQLVRLIESYRLTSTPAGLPNTVS